MLEDIQNIKDRYLDFLKNNNIDLDKNYKIDFTNLVSTSKIFVLSALRDLTQHNIYALFLDEASCLSAYKDYVKIFSKQNILITSANSPEKTIETINTISSSQKLLIFTYTDALTKKCIDKKLLQSQTVEVDINLYSKGYNALIELINDKKYTKVDFVYNPGEYAIRGNIIDLFSYAEKVPYRVIFSGNTIKQIRLFNPEDQLSIEDKSLQSFKIVPYIENHGPDSLINFINKQDLLIIDKPNIIQEKLNELVQDNSYANITDIRSLESTNHIISINHKSKNAEKSIDFKVSAPNVFNKDFSLILQELNSNKLSGIQNFIFATKSQLNPQYLYDILQELAPPDLSVDKSLFKIIDSELTNGFVDQNLKIACYSYNQIFGKKRTNNINKIAKPKRNIKHIFNEIQPGDYISHIDYGIGKLTGIERVQTRDKTQECLRIVYADNDLLYLNVNALNKISKYHKKSEGEVKLSKLGSLNWDRLKANTKRKIKDIGRDLIALYAKRKIENGFAYSPDSYLQYKMESAFPYEDTPDQARANIEIKKDMEAPYPMDRLICGDVGFGKTELAIRASYKAFLNNKQVAVLVPTTLLTSQHTNTFKKRLNPFGVTIDFLNRFKTSSEIKQTLQKLENGDINIIIGTHRLLSKDIKFQDLGLLIVDEEQKFGVSSKEKIKNLKLNVDTLTLTATPIPRTLKHSLMGARDISTLNTPPPNRQPVTTQICTFNSDALKEALEYEISRGGQAFIIHNKIKDIDKLSESIRKLIPEARIGIGHGQMDGETLEQVIYKFINKEYDILISTTIIESGIDIASANTIIINNAHMFGLSDLHQMRGRVGRSSTKSYCYLVVPSLSSLTQEAKERIFTLEEFSELGDGFKIAMRDLDIRGAGNILGAEQSGFIADMGLETYNKVLNEAIAELKQDEFKDVFKDQVNETEYVLSTKVDVDEDTIIPNTYVVNNQERYNLYMRISRAKNDNDLTNLEYELIDRFGPIPSQTTSLFNLIKIQNISKYLGIEKLILKKHKLILKFAANTNSIFYDSPIFKNIIDYTLNNPLTCSMSESPKGLSLAIKKIDSLSKALNLLIEIRNYKPICIDNR